jgi:small subunit ribosomal protein S6
MDYLLQLNANSIAKTAGKLILSNNGVIRGITNWGVYALPKPLPNRSGKSGQTSSSSPNSAQSNTSATSGGSAMQQNRTSKHTIAHNFILRFDASARTQHLLRKTWNSDPRLLRFSVVKVGEKLDDICDVGGRAEEWDGVEGAEGSLGGEGMYLEKGDIGRAERDVVGTFWKDERGVGGGSGGGDVGRARLRYVH